MRQDPGQVGLTKADAESDPLDPRSALYDAFRRCDAYGECGQRRLGRLEALCLALLGVTLVPVKLALIVSVLLLGWLLVRCAPVISYPYCKLPGNSTLIYLLMQGVFPAARCIAERTGAARRPATRSLLSAILWVLAYSLGQC